MLNHRRLLATIPPQLFLHRSSLGAPHKFDEMDKGEAHILTLKDSRILDNEEDELQNVEMAEAERMRKNNELKIKRCDYAGYDDDEFAAENQGMRRAILTEYGGRMNHCGPCRRARSLPLAHICISLSNSTT